MSDPDVSVVVVAYNMRRELPRTLTSLSRQMQRGTEEIDYEVIVVDNGSDPPVDQPEIPSVTVIRVAEPTPSPAHALNEGIAAARGGLIGACIDGARMASPGIIHYAAIAARMHPRPVIGTLGFHLGPSSQPQSVATGYDQAAEDALLASSGWEEDGYRLFSISSFARSSGEGWFKPISESNALFLPRALWTELGGFDERFVLPGGGLVNLDTWARACALPDSQVFILLGEGTFHQVHGGVATNATVSPVGSFQEEYVALRGRPFERPISAPVYLGEVRAVAQPSIAWSASRLDVSAPPDPEHSAMNVLVMGMHRSGTSAIAGALRAAGLWAGEDAAFKPASPDNPAGFAELEALVEFNERLLESLGWTWDSPPPEPLAHPPDRADLVEEGRRLVAATLEGARAWAFKDPRLSLLLPWWRRILLDRFVGVVAVRPMEEVAWSLAIRDGFPVESGLALAAAYQRHLAAGLDGLPVIVVDYRALVEDPGTLLPEVFTHLERMGVRGSFDVRAAAATVRPDLHRPTRPGSLAAGSLLTGSLRQIENAWSVGGVRAFDRFSLEVAGPERWEVALLDMNRWVRREREQGRAVQSAAAAAEAEVRTLRAIIVGLEARHERRPPARRTLPLPLRRNRRRMGAAITGRWRSIAPAWLARLKPNPLFDRAWYLEQYPDVGLGGEDPYRHYRSRGVAERRDPNPLFDTDWYLEHNPDVQASGLNPLDHYLGHGGFEGRDPGPNFDSDWYLLQNPDVKETGSNPLLHYLRHGAAEGRRPTSP